MAVNESVNVLIVGGGLCGVLAGQRCAAQGLSFRIVDKGTDFGGTWVSLANEHSQLQVDSQSTADLQMYDWACSDLQTLAQVSLLKHTLYCPLRTLLCATVKMPLPYQQKARAGMRGAVSLGQQLPAGEAASKAVCGHRAAEAAQLC